MNPERMIYLPGGKKHEVPMPDTSTVTKPKRKRLPTFDESIHDIQEIQHRERELDLWTHDLTVDVKTPNDWFPVLPLSDFHIGSFSTDYEKLQEYLFFARKNNIKLLLLGDLADMFMPGKVPSGAQNDVSVEMQMHTIREFFKEYNDLILANISDPSHTGWLDQLTGIDFYRTVIQEYDVPLLETGGNLHINVNDQEYALSLWHQIANYNSSLNPLNAHRRIAQMHSEVDPDIIISGHVHKGAAEYDKTIRGKKRLMVQCGTFKTLPGDKYARKGFVGGVAQFHPLILLNAKRHDFEMITELDTAQEMLDALELIHKVHSQALLGYGTK